MAIKTNMFDNYQNIPEDYIPNNTTPWVYPEDGVTDIIVGSNPDHFLYVPFNIARDVEQIVVTYRQYAINTLTKVFVPNDVSSDSEGNNILYYSLTSAETSKFKPIKNTPCEIQMWVKFKPVGNNPGKISVSDKYYVNILESLYVEEHDSEQ